MKIFSHDPGTTNYGYAVIEWRVKNGEPVFRCVENGMAPHRIHDLKNHRERRRQKNEFRDWASQKIEEHDCDAIIGERFMTRGIKGPTVESVNMMLGILQSFDLPDCFIPAATWKNAITRTGIEMNDLYRACRTQRHQLDAAFIGVYGIFMGMNIKDFGSYWTRKRLIRFIDEVESTSTTRLINRVFK